MKYQFIGSEELVLAGGMGTNIIQPSQFAIHCSPSLCCGLNCYIA